MAVMAVIICIAFSHRLMMFQRAYGFARNVGLGLCLLQLIVAKLSYCSCTLQSGGGVDIWGFSNFFYGIGEISRKLLVGE